MSAFIGANLRLARLFHGLSLSELGDELGKSKQFLSRIETGIDSVSTELEEKLAERLWVLPDFFRQVDPMPIADEQCHFRKQLTTKVALRQSARARGEILKRLVGYLDERLDLPAYSVAEADASTSEQIELGAERCRASWGLGRGPISNITRVAENSGAVVTFLSGMAAEVDAVSFATRRPVIALNPSSRSVCRTRFGIAHELGHFALHQGVLTGDRLTESQANRFASALLLPRSTFASESRLAVRGTRLNWQGLSELKLRWGVSKSAIIYRGRQLGLFTEDQARAGFIGLKRGGEAIQENEDAKMVPEAPEVLRDGIEMLKAHFGIPLATIARVLYVQPALLGSLFSHDEPSNASEPNVIQLFGESR